MKTTIYHKKPALLVHLAIITLFCGVLLSGPAVAAIKEHQIQIEYAFDPSAVPDKTVVGYHLYKDGELVCDLDATDPHLLECAVTTPTGKFDFTMTAVYNDGSTSPHSAPFPYIIVDETSPLLGLMVLTGQSPQDIEGLGEMAGSGTVDLADVISLLQQQSASAL